MEDILCGHLGTDGDAVAVVPGLAAVATHPRDLPLGPLAVVGPHGAGTHLRSLFGGVAVAFARFRLSPGHRGSSGSLLILISSLSDSKTLSISSSNEWLSLGNQSHGGSRTGFSESLDAFGSS